MQVAPQSNLPEFKVVFVGDASVGKTSIIMRYHHGVFSEGRQSTIGAGFVSKEVKSQYGLGNLHVWDTAGQERYRCLVPMYSRGSNVAVIVFDVTSRESFQDLEDWIGHLKVDIGESCKIIIAANKIDLSISPEFRSEIDAWSQKNEIDVVYVSAKTGENIELLFQMVVNFLPRAAFLVNQPVVNEVNEKKGCCQ
ncbi:small GTP-binding protein [Tritrichomonas foetus]|uniref:Small GTP-binding protein n=1 Tax=Tritrichomonas foetus TaxID=1144522 RepID=A0A1J4KBR9_9EUKA|nr:small GTP-binding protein [Tritrichomonas foetus]|eukprot:OHT08857.1 small GTP-binding protein [Tritrichomonas foetus]